MKKVINTAIPLRKNIVIAFCLSVLLLISTYISSQLLIIRMETDNFITELQGHTKEHLSSTKILLDGMVNDLERTADMLSGYDDIWHPDVKERLQISQNLNFFDATFISDTAGNAYAHNGETFSIADQAFFQEAGRSQEITFSEILPSKRFGAIQIMAYPLSSNANPQEVKGFLFGLYDANKFSHTITSHISNKYIYIVDSNGNYINTFVENQEMSKSRNFWNDFAPVKMNGTTIEELEENFRNHAAGDFSYSYGNVRRYGYHMPLGIKDWQIILSVDESIIDTRVKNLSTVSTIASIINWACLTVMLWSAYSYFKKANQDIQKASQRVSKNHEIMRLAVESSDRVIFEYNINTKNIELKTKLPHHLSTSAVVSHVPENFIKLTPMADDSIAELRSLFERIKTETSSQADIQFIGHSNNNIWYRIFLQNIYNEQGEIISTVGSAEDISMLKKGETAIKRREEVHRSLIKTSLLYARVDLSAGMILELNGEDTKLSYEKVLKENIPNHICKEYHSYVMQALSLESLQEAYQQDKEYVEVQFQYKRKPDDTIRWASILVYRVHENEGTNVTFVVRDIDEKKRAELALKRQATIDGLTGLYNAATTRSKIGHLLASQHPCDGKQIFILFDLDNFKKINDTFGHAMGDQVLIDVASKLKKHFRSTDIVGRLGGDEFIAMLCDVKSDQYIEDIAGILSPELQQTYTQGDTSITVSASMGIAVSPQDGITFEELYKKSDIALYQVKKSGKNGYKRWTE